MNALLVEPPFREYHFIDLDKLKIASLEEIAGSRQRKLFGNSDMEKVSNSKIAEAFRKRLNKVAGFRSVPKPIAMRNTQNAVVYYLFFASHKIVAEGIVKDIFKKYKNRRG
jgi:hypothetical protein